MYADDLGAPLRYVVGVGLCALVLVLASNGTLARPVSVVRAAVPVVSVVPPPAPPVCAPDDPRLNCPQSLTAAQIDTILAGTPAAGTGAAWRESGEHWNIDAAIALAFFWHESTFGTNPAWAGVKPDGTTTHNPGNIICAQYPTCYGRFRDYPDWRTGIDDWYRLIAVEYIDGRGHQTIADVVPIYAPAFENNVDGYVTVVDRTVSAWRAQYR